MKQNLYDNLSVDVKKIYKKYPITKTALWTKSIPPTQNLFLKIYRTFFIPLKYRNYLWLIFHRIGLDQSWFDDFKVYWSTILAGRPLWGLPDFYFLRNIYRIRFKDNYIPAKTTPKQHLGAWQHPGLLYQLFHQVYKESLANKLEILQCWKKYKKGESRSLLKFGCGTAPITSTFFEFYRNQLNLEFYIADIQTLSFHYAVYKFRHLSNVHPILLKLKDNFILKIKKKIDVIFCIEVFEHLNKPLQTIKLFHKILNKNGLLFFDYIKGTSEGLNTTQGVNERNGVINFISKNFKLVNGNIDKNKNIYLTIVRKK